MIIAHMWQKPISNGMGASYEVYNRGHGYERNLLIILSFRGCGGSVCVCVWGGGGGGGCTKVRQCLWIRHRKLPVIRQNISLLHPNFHVLCLTWILQKTYIVVLKWLIIQSIIDNLGTLSFMACHLPQQLPSSYAATFWLTWPRCGTDSSVPWANCVVNQYAL